MLCHTTTFNTLSLWGVAPYRESVWVRIALLKLALLT